MYIYIVINNFINNDGNIGKRQYQWIVVFTKAFTYTLINNHNEIGLLVINTIKNII